MAKEPEANLKSRASFDLWNSLFLPVCLLNKRGELECFSAGFIRLFCLSSGICKNFEELIHPEDREEFRRFLNYVEGNDKSKCVYAEKKFRARDNYGGIFKTLISAEFIDSDDAPSFLLWFSPETHIENDEFSRGVVLTEALGVIASGLVDGAFVVNMEGKIVNANEVFLDLLGYQLFEVVDKPVGMLFAGEPSLVEKATHSFGKIMKYGKVRELELNLRKKNGGKILVSFNGSVIRGSDNQLIGVLGIVEDLQSSKGSKEIEKREKELEKAYRELDELNLIKDDFLSLVGHELRTPLANILGYAEFLARERLSEEESQEFKEIIYQEALRLSRLVNDILDLSRMERGKLSYYHILGDVNGVIRDAVLTMEQEFAKKGIKLMLDLGQIKKNWIDPDRIKQVVLNILGNALKFSEPDTEVKVSSREEDDGILVYIQDQGIGIEEKDADKVFAKFGQIEDLRHHSQGAGLGLPIAKRIVEEGHKGRIWFESKGAGKGTTFYFWLPYLAGAPL